MIKSFLTKGILNDGKIVINRNYELPLNLEIDYTSHQINMEVDRFLEIEIEVYGRKG